MNQFENEHEHWRDWIEKRVCAKETLFGTLKFFGQTNFSDGLWCGIALDNPFGKNDGMVNGIRYFHCEPNFGIFVPSSKVVKMEKPLIEIASEDGLNQTFKIPGNKIEKCELNTKDNVDSFAESFKNNNHSNSKYDSSESLGLLNPDLIQNLEDSWNLSLEKTFQKHSNNENLEDPVFIAPTLNIENIFSDGIDFPLYASTPRLPHKNINVFPTQLESEDCNDPFEVTFDVDKFKNNPNLSSTSKTLEISSVPVEENINSFESLNNTKTVLKNGDIYKDNLNDTFNLSKIPECSESLEISKAEDTQHLKTCVNNAEFALKQVKIPLNSTFEKCVEVSPQNLPVVEMTNPENISLNMDTNRLEDTFVINSMQMKECSSSQQNKLEYKSKFIKSSSIECVNTTNKLSADQLSSNMNDNKSLNSTFKSKKVKTKADTDLIPKTIKSKSSIHLNQGNSCKEDEDFKKPFSTHKIVNLKAKLPNKCIPNVKTNVNTNGPKFSKLFSKQSRKEQISIKPTNIDSLDIPLISNVQNSTICLKTVLKDKQNHLPLLNKKNVNQENKLLPKLCSKTLPAPKSKIDKSAKDSTVQQSKFSKTYEAVSLGTMPKCLAKPFNGNILNRSKCQSFNNRERGNLAVQKVERRHSLNVGFNDKLSNDAIKPRYSMIPGVLKTVKLAKPVSPLSCGSKTKESVNENMQSSAREIKPQRKSMIAKNETSKLKRPSLKRNI